MSFNLETYLEKRKEYVEEGMENGLASYLAYQNTKEKLAMETYALR